MCSQKELIIYIYSTETDKGIKFYEFLARKQIKVLNYIKYNIKG